ncbi:maltose acetyltransferase [Paenibacillus sp. CFBP13512]|uniref:sugar O-acetyltransferase n=1 Tax=Paenibacillus sp. CFBP13512 TaxID=2184007 RepID=UPI0010BFC34A|nr:sugar O-acetyltransferase [Paenibacillus sp. CFBP13512]TKJ91434.1 maltose acetyltransferase [Paenibacillus sp. CFBP13512]
MATDKEKMLAQKLYMAGVGELATDNKKSRMLTRLFNNTTEEQWKYRTELLQQLLESAGKNVFIEPPFRCDYGCHITIGNNFYANYDCIIIDVAKVKIGNNVFFGPRVGVYTAGHPIDPDVRNTLLEFGKEITIGNDVWIGANAVINPGVTIGNNVIIGSGSVVTKDIPDNVIAVGNPCKVLRAITAEDKQYWEQQKAEYEADIEH